MPDDESRFSISLKRRFQKVNSQTTAQRAGPVESGGNSGPNPEGSDFDRSAVAPGTAPTKYASGRKPDPQQFKNQDVKAPSDEKMGGEVMTPGSVEPRSNASSSSAPQKKNLTGVPSTGERKVDASEQSEEGTPNSSGTTDEEQPAFSEVQHSLTEIFTKKAVSNPLVKALLERHGTVDARELTDELNQFARSIGAWKDGL